VSQTRVLGPVSADGNATMASIPSTLGTPNGSKSDLRLRKPSPSRSAEANTSLHTGRAGETPNTPRSGRRRKHFEAVRRDAFHIPSVAAEKQENYELSPQTSCVKRSLSAHRKSRSKP